ncbi:hypothetical protein TNCV_4900531 [Trichonephila clavipes]|nr:hypothetical protein TNCV_4900531 [Trichonephila clavipes]
MPNLPSQTITDVPDWRKIWRLFRPRKGSNSAETVLSRPCHVNTSIVLLKNVSWCLGMVHVDTGSFNEEATCAWMTANEAVGCIRAFPAMWRSSRQLHPVPGLRVNDISQILATQSERPN